MSANSPNPLVPQGSLQQQQTGTAKSKVRVAVFSIIAVHAVLFLGVLMQGGCKKDEPKAPEVATGQPPVAPDPFYGPGDLNSSNTTASTTPVGGAPVSGTPAPTADPFAPVGAAPVTSNVPSTLPPTGPAPVADVGMAPGAPTGLAEPSSSVQQYTIVKGDNFYTIAKSHHTTTKKIIDANPNVDPAKLKLGQKINIPVSSPASAPATTTVSGASPTSAPVASGGSSTTTTYVVKAGDTLYGIAKKNGTTAKAIKSANNLKTDRISVGQKLKVSAKASASAAPVAEPVLTTPVSVVPPATLTSSVPATPGPR